LAERWDGSQWSIQSTPNADGAYAFLGVSCPGASDCIAVGISHRSGSQQTLAERWHGGVWTIEYTPSPVGIAELNAVSCPSASACTAVGDHWNGSTIHRALVERWNGRKWTIQHIPKSANAGSELELNGVSCASESACTAVGTTGGGYPSNSGQGHMVALRWNGRRWSVQRTARSGRGVLFGVSCPSARWCVAVGYKPGKALAERWNGKGWSFQPAPHGVGPDAVSCSSTRACTAVGGGDAERWNGALWSKQRTPDPGDNYLYGVSCPTAHDCTATGHSSGGSYYFTTIEQWTG
jgi:hypothetical protein